MRSRKTPQNERGTHTYHFDDGRKVTIKPGEEGRRDYKTATFFR